MKNILKYLLIIFVSFQGIAQSYVQLGDFNATKLTVDAPTLLELNIAADSLLAIFPSAFQNDFKVYDVGTYLHQEYTKDDGIKSSIDIAEQKVAAQSPYYLLLGKESNLSGIYQKYWVRLKLPASAEFACLTTESRNMIVNNLIASLRSSPSKQQEFHKAEIDCIILLKELVNKVVNCDCTFNRSLCETDEFKAFDRELLGFGFRKKEIEIVGKRAWTSGEQGIYDYTGENDQTHKLISIDGATYYIPEQVIDSKGVFDSKSITYEVYDPESDTFHDTTVSTNINGEVYILDNGSYNNGEWDNAKNAALTKDFVEYWVILHDNNTNKDFLYSRFTFGQLSAPAVTALQGDGSQVDRSTPLSPWGLALKALGNAALEACMEAVINRFTDEKINTWGDAFKSISITSALWSGASSLLPWKKSKTDMVIIALTNALFMVIDKAIHGGPDYTVQDGLKDFVVGFGSNIAMQWLGPKLVTSGKFLVEGFSRFIKNNNVQVINDLVGYCLSKCVGEGSGCFVNNTKVQTAAGTLINISDINIGDYVLTNKSINKGEAAAANNTPNTQFYKVEFENLNKTKFCSKVLSHLELRDLNITNEQDTVLLAMPEESLLGQFIVTRITNFKLFDENHKPERGEYVGKRVLGTYKYLSNDFRKLLLSSGDTIYGTSNHPFYSLAKNSWVPLSTLQKGDSILAKSGVVFVLDNTKSDEIDYVYNLEVADNHNYLISDCGIVVHNGKYFSCVDLKKLVKDFENHFSKPTQKLAIKLIWKFTRKEGGIAYRGNFFEELVKKVYYKAVDEVVPPPKNTWIHTSWSHAVIDFYKIAGKKLEVVSMKTTTLTDPIIFINSVKGNLDKLKNKVQVKDAFSDTQSMHIYVPNLTPDMETQWANAIHTYNGGVYKNITIVLKTIETSIGL